MIETSNVHFFQNKKFQTAQLGCFFRLPLTQENLAYATLLALYQGNVSHRYQTMQQQAARLAELYDVNLSIFPQVRGNKIIFQVRVEWIEPSLILDQDYTNAQVVELARAILLEPLFTDNAGEMLRYTKNELFDEIDEFFDAPDNVAFYDFYQKYYVDHPDYSRTLFGDIDLLHNISLEELHDFHRQLLDAPALVIGTGRDVLELTDLVMAKLVTQIPGLKREFTEQNLRIAPVEHDYQEITKQFGAQQAQLFMGYAVLNPPINRWIGNVFTQYLGGDESSILFRNVRERLGAAYAIDALNYNDNNLLVVTAGLEKDKVEASKLVIKDELQKIAAGAIDRQLLEQAKSSLVRQRKMLFDRQKNIMAVKLNAELRGVKESEAEIERQITLVSQKMIQDFASQLLLKESYILE